MPNFLAEFALLAWAPICLILFRLFKPPTAATIALLGSSVLLPANFAVHFPGIPEIDRHVAGAAGALLGYVLLVPRRLRARRPLGWDAALLATLTVSSFISAVMNPDALDYGDIHLPALSARESLGLVSVRCLTIVVPFFIGSRLIRSPQDVLAVLRTFVAFGLVYVPMILWEAKMSPEIHTTLYGYFPHEFLQHLRAGGFRPVVLTGSGLECGLFVASALIAAVGLHKAGVRLLGLPTLLPVVLLLVALVLCLSLGPLIYGLSVPLLILAARPSTQAKVGIAVAAVVLAYPLLRSQDLFPTNSVVAAADYVSGDRAFSIDFRFENEDRLLAKASERPIFGWGGWGRNRVYDAETSSDVSVTDGAWIIELGQFGLTGFLSLFLLLVAPIVLTMRRRRFLPGGSTGVVILCLGFVLLVRAVDLIPNGFLAPITLFLAGALMPFTRAPRRAPALGTARPRTVRVHAAVHSEEVDG